MPGLRRGWRWKRRVDRLTKTMRAEQEVFTDLSKLCRSPGYVHVIAYFCYRDNWVSYKDKMSANDTLHLFSMKRLVRTEISTLIGLMVQDDINYTLPTPDVFQQYIEQTEILLVEMHNVLAGAFLVGQTPDKTIDAGTNMLTSGQAMREPIFYGSESAYSFQYRDFSPKRYERDDVWLIKNKGFSIQLARNVIHGIGELQNQKINHTLKRMKALAPDEWTILPGFTFKVSELVEISGIDNETIIAVLNAFSLSCGEKNELFQSISDFNITNAAPLLRLEGDLFLLFQHYSLVESLYESPFYWMWEDKKYRNELSENRGRFTEEFCKERLELVFGEKRVYTNVDIFESKDKVGEIDVLIVFGNRLVVVQAKSKRLTLEARKGNDQQIKDDFKKSVQDAYDQGLNCSKSLCVSKYRLVDANSQVVTIPKGKKEIYILCVVADHYPALSFQARHFLNCETIDSIHPPLVLDVFTLDAMTEMLQSPLHFLSYVNRRASYSEKILTSHELTILSYHLKNNLWLDDKYNIVQLGDDISADLDVAMAVRRDGIKGKRTPSGILTRFASTALGRIVKEIEANPDPRTLDLGFLLLTLSEDTVIDVSQGIDRLMQLALLDHKSHDITVGLDIATTGLTIHINDDPQPVAGPLLQNHCERRKYSQKGSSWFGICISPTSNSLRFGINLSYKWQQSSQMDFITRDMPRSGNINQARTTIRHKHKIGRNDPCPCGSGVKLKKCCLRK